MILYQLFSVGIGAIFGACLRFFLGNAFNQVFPTLPLGTLICNLVGGFIIGLVVVATKNHLIVSENIRLLIVTGFLGSFTTFSTFSAETVNLFTHQQYFWASVIIIAHVLGSLVATVSGMILMKYILNQVL